MSVKYIKITQRDWNAISLLVDISLEEIGRVDGPSAYDADARQWRSCEKRVNKQVHHKFKMDRMQKVRRK